MRNDLYFDFAAATPLDKDVLKVMEPYFSDYYFNPSALYEKAHSVHHSIDQARQNVSGILEVKPQEIVFTSGCTESNNIAIHGIMRRYPGAKILISSIEHDSVKRPAEEYNCVYIDVDSEGKIDIEDLSKKLTDDVVLVSVIFASNEIGVIQDFTRIADVIGLARAKRANSTPLYFHTDAAQAVNYIPLRPHAYGIDLMSLNGSKIYGPKGSGCLFVSTACTLLPFIYGGGQEQGLRSGTENVSAIIGFAEALKKTEKMRRYEVERLVPLRDEIIHSCLELGGIINGSLSDRLPNSVSVRFNGKDNETIMYKLDAKGISIATGSACHAANGTMSTVLSALGLSEEDAKSSLRITLGRQTTLEGVRVLIETLAEILAK